MSATESWAKSPAEHARNVAINEARVADAAFSAPDWTPTDYLPGGEYAGGLAGAHGAELTPELLAGLPDPLREMCEAVAATRGAPISAAVAMGLAALGGACGGIARVQPFPDDNPSWHEPVSVSVAIIMASGTGKTGLGADFIGGHGEYADRLRLQSADAMRRAAARVKASKRRLPDLERQAGKDGAEGIAGLDALEREIADIEQAEKDARGPRPVLVGTNVNTEGLVALLADQGRAFVVADESSGLDAILGLYSGKSLTGDVNNALDESRVEVVRKNADRNRSVKRPSLTMALLLQPSVLDELRGDKRANGGGFTARLLYVVPADPGASRPGRERPAFPVGVRERWDALIADLCAARDEVYDQDGDPRAGPFVVFSPEAQAVFDRYDRSARPREMHAPTSATRSWRAKQPGRVASIAALLHLCRHGADGTGIPVGAQDVGAAILLGDAYDAHALVAVGGSDALDSDPDPTRRLAQAIFDWARKRGDGTYAPFTSSEVRPFKWCRRRAQYGERGPSDNIAAAIHMLADQGMASVEVERVKGNDVLTVYLNPDAVEDAAEQ